MAYNDRTTWDADNKIRLLMAIINEADVHVDYEAAAKAVGCTAKAAKNQFLKLRAQTKNDTDAAGDGTGASKNTKRKVAVGDNASDNLDNETPSKKAKASKGSKAPERKAQNKAVSKGKGSKRDEDE